MIGKFFKIRLVHSGRHVLLTRRLSNATPLFFKLDIQYQFSSLELFIAY